MQPGELHDAETTVDVNPIVPHLAQTANVASEHGARPHTVLLASVLVGDNDTHNGAGKEVSSGARCGIGVAAHSIAVRQLVVWLERSLAAIMAEHAAAIASTFTLEETRAGTPPIAAQSVACMPATVAVAL